MRYGLRLLLRNLFKALAASMVRTLIEVTLSVLLDWMLNHAEEYFGSWWGRRATGWDTSQWGYGYPRP